MKEHFLTITITGREYAAKEKADKQYPQDRKRERERERLRVQPARGGKENRSLRGKDGENDGCL